MSVRANINLDQGASFLAQLKLNTPTGDPIDLSMYSVESQIRKNYTSRTNYQFDTTANSSGIIVMSLTANSSAAIVAGRYVYDVILTSGSGSVIRIMEGQVTVNPGVSR